MSSLTSRLLRAVPLVAVALVAACSDSLQSPIQRAPGSRSATSFTDYPNCTQAQQDRAYTLIEALYAPTTASAQVKGQWTATLQQVKQGDYADAQTRMFGIVDQTNHYYDIGILADTQGSLSETTGQAISELYNITFPCVALPTPGDISRAFTPAGGAVTVDVPGTTLKAHNNQSAVRLANGVVDSKRLLVLQPIPHTAGSNDCLSFGTPNGSGFREYGNCYEIKLTPAVTGTFATPAAVAICTFPTTSETGATAGSPAPAVHDRLRLASRHEATSDIVVYDRDATVDLANDMTATHACESATLVTASLPLTGHAAATRFAARKTLIDRMMAWVGRTVGVTPAYASDGLGSFDVGDFSRFSAVDPVITSTGREATFEAGVPAWTTSTATSPAPQWNLGDFSTLTNGAYTKKYVDLAANDASKGKLPAPAYGTRGWWYGTQAGTGVTYPGNYMGAPASQSNNSGGTSLTTNSGTLSAVDVTIPQTDNNFTLRFWSWFEIESVAPSTSDQMTVTITPQTGTATVTQINPTTNPVTGLTVAKQAPIPFTSTGYNLAPTWVPYVVPIPAAYRGQKVTITFSFATNTTSYNGFRGWAVDDVCLDVNNRHGGSTPCMVH